MTADSHMMNADTQAILLLCGHLSMGFFGAVSPLTLSEYNLVATWLKKQSFRPAGLLDSEISTAAATDLAAKIDSERLKDLLQRGTELAMAVETWSSIGIWILSRSDEAYPDRLRKRLGLQAPALLFGVGNLRRMSDRMIGVVGSRKAAEAALDLASRVGAAAANEGLSVVSGGAKGIDSAAVRGATEAGGTAVVVLAEGVERPAVSSVYREHIRNGDLALVTLYAPFTRWTTGNALGRNKLIYALSEATLVVSSETRGGTWTGALENLKHAWAPLLVHADGDVPPGNRKLLAQGGQPFQMSDIRRLANQEPDTPIQQTYGTTGDLFADVD